MNIDTLDLHCQLEKYFSLKVYLLIKQKIIASSYSRTLFVWSNSSCDWPRQHYKRHKSKLLVTASPRLSLILNNVVHSSRYMNHKEESCRLHFSFFLFEPSSIWLLTLRSLRNVYCTRWLILLRINVSTSLKRGHLIKLKVLCNAAKTCKSAPKIYQSNKLRDVIRQTNRWQIYLNLW